MTEYKIDDRGTENIALLILLPFRQIEDCDWFLLPEPLIRDD